MKILIALALIAIVAARPEEDYSRYDNFNINEIIENLRLLKSYNQCFLETGKCTPEGSDFKKWIPDAVQTSCGKCSDKQKVLVAKVINATIKKLPEDWEKLNKKHNPDGKYEDTLKEFLEKYGH